MGSDVTACLDEDHVLAFVSGTLDRDSRQATLDHLDTCETCRALASMLASDEDVQFERPHATAPPPSERLVPTEETIDGRFRLRGTLGQGAMGVVYRAHDDKLGTDVALKLLRPEAADGGSTRAFAREVSVGRRITHPNVCRLYDAGEWEGAAYITMELVEGETLAELLVRGRIPEARARALLEGIAAGLAAVHEQGIIHRDLKPANVMVERTSGRPVLTDFGFATELSGDHSRRLVGTPSFWAPEQARGETPTPASDVYSFGVLAYRLLAGREFSLSDASAFAKLPSGWRGVVIRCLEPRPGDRYRDASAIRRALRPRLRVPIWAVAGAAVLASAAAFAGLRGSADAGSTARVSLSPPSSVGTAPVPPLFAPEPSYRNSTASSPTPAPSAEKGPPVTGIVATTRPARHPPIVTSARVATSTAVSTSPSPPPEGDPLYRH